MWRRLSSQFRTLTPLRSTAKSNRLSAAATSSLSSSLLPSPATLRLTVPLFSRHLSTASENVVKKVEDVMPTATGHEREELEAELQGKDLRPINFPEGFGTKEAPIVIQYDYDNRLINCRGGEENKHDVVRFWLEKGKPRECPVCKRNFVLEVKDYGLPPECGWVVRTAAVTALGMIVNESLRLYPPVAATIRRAKMRTTLEA